MVEAGEGVMKKASRHQGIEALRKGNREAEKIKHPQITQITQIF